MKTVALVGTFDSKGTEYQYIKQLLEKLDLNVFTIHTGVFESSFVPDVDVSEIAEQVGENIAQIRQRNDRAYATEILAKGLEILLPKLYEENLFEGVLSFGGTGGTSLVAPGMRQLPIGLPKLIVSTVASGDTSVYVGTSDIIMMPSIVDVSGLNKISKRIFGNAVSAMAGLLNYRFETEEDERPLIATTMFGVTTPAVNYAREYLEKNGYEVLVFHATGVGGRTMESLISDGYFKGVLDLTTTEWADQLVGGILNAGEKRLEAAALAKVPQVVSLGAMDMVNFGPFDTVPEKFKERLFYKHNPTVTLMRTTVEENKKLGQIIAEKLNLVQIETVLTIPKNGFSGIDVVDGPFYYPEADLALIDALKKHLNNEKVKLIELDYAINDQAFAEFSAQQLINLIDKKGN
ncbi:Tm-1-like ATP-binding domain-containing protein [Enterococcus sp. ALS3]|uniref:Tm-1-like ATP-binding domain-containing protein n=1 Tax=Enterococcus alishanensis TaxID=1303817 RepID=A0ABS6TA14_9ENTE|nr:Tm-1-like ATP-binding domain-containing protein [Enterococcus alishanensis]MBV7389738.1 Tm-1-like ATP-binding domain-containing protein [Enterococcus alishanensis]